MKIENGLGLEGTEEETAAIAKIQAVQRGKIARKEVEGMKAEGGEQGAAGSNPGGGDAGGSSGG